MNVNRQEPRLTIGAAFYHPAVQKDNDLGDILGLHPIHNRTASSLTAPELEKRKLAILFHGQNYRTGEKDYVFFELSKKHYGMLPTEGNMYWVMAPDEASLNKFLTNTGQFHKGITPSYYAVDLDGLLRRLVWAEGLSGEERDRIQLQSIHASLEGQRGTSNVTDIQLSTGVEDASIMKKGIVALLDKEIHLKVREVRILCRIGNITTEVAIDGGGRFRTRKYRDLQRLLPFARVLSLVATSDLFVKVDRPAIWQDFYIQGWSE